MKLIYPTSDYDDTSAPIRLYVKLRSLDLQFQSFQQSVIFKNSISEVFTVSILAFFDADFLTIFPKVGIFLATAVFMRLLWNSAIVIHGFGHTVFTAILDKNLTFVNCRNILENRKTLDVIRRYCLFSQYLSHSTTIRLGATRFGEVG